MPISSLNNQAIRLAVDYKQKGNLEDINQAIRTLEQALREAGQGSKLLLMYNLGVMLRMRFERTESMNDLNRAIDFASDAINTILGQHRIYTRLSYKPSRQFERTGLMKGLHHAINFSIGLDDALGDHPNMISKLNNLGNWLAVRFERSGSMNDLNRAIDLAREAISVIHKDDPDLPVHLNSLGNKFYTRFERKGSMDDLNFAIDFAKLAVDFTPEGHPDRAGRLRHFADIWSSVHGQEPADTSMIQTSISLRDRGKNQNLTNAISIYKSDIAESPTYIQELAASVLRGSQLQDTESLERVLKILPELLREFSLKIGGEKKALAHFEIMKFHHLERIKIAEYIEKYYPTNIDDTELSPPKTSNTTPDEKDNWRVVSAADDPTCAVRQQRPNKPSRVGDVKRDCEDRDDKDDFRVPKYRDIIADSTAFRWLLYRVHREVSLTSSEANMMHAIATEIRRVLYSRQENCITSSTRRPPKCSMMFESDWDPVAFLCEQEYTSEPGDALDGAIMIIQGANGDTEAITCSEYLSRTWPLLGEDFIGLVKQVVRNKSSSRVSVTLFDHTELTAWLEPPGRFVLEALGLVETIVEVGEVYGLITTALRSTLVNTVASAMPILDISIENYAPVFKAKFFLRRTGFPSHSISKCWLGLFQNPTVVLDFPVRRRQLGQEQGLEISLATLAALIGTRRIAVFCGKVFLKGFCTILVPTKYARDTVHWHVLFNDDGSRISFTDPRVRQVAGDFDLLKHLTLSGIETARHIVGWCKHVQNFAGSRQASYDIHTTGLQRPDARFAFDRVSVSAGKFINVVGSVTIGKKDKPGRASKTSDYHKQLEWAERKFVVFYDWKDRRAWLIDGLSALLHLVRSSLAHRRRLGHEVLFKEDKIEEPDTPYTGKAAANAVLRNRANMDLKIYEKWNRIVEETVIKGEEPPERTEKRQRTWEQLPDLVGDICTTLGMLVDIQTDVSTADGFGTRVHKSPRRHLNGWDFQDVATGADPLWPKAALLHDYGLGWVDLVRTVSAITLFGDGFGEILLPIDEALGAPRADIAAKPLHIGTRCTRWATLPKDEDLLATTTPVIRDIMESVHRGLDSKLPFRELCQGIYWHSPDMVFEDCCCLSTPGRMQCNRVQVLLPTKFPKLFARGFRTPPAPLPAHGAVIFGHSVKFPLIWNFEAGSVPTQGYPACQLTSPSSHQSNSGESDEQTDSGDNPSLGNVSTDTATSSSDDSVKDIIKCLFKRKSDNTGSADAATSSNKSVKNFDRRFLNIKSDGKSKESPA
ncbi:hypothetical protein F4679DRAFT_502942 [Xylaria curta]|nr:hypothetical protein F4679DRAFT_502942 [Xylaria curta]